MDHVDDRRRQGAERRQRAFGGVGRPGVGHEPEHHELAVLGLRDERHRRAGHDIGDRRELVRGGLREGDERCDHVGRRGQHQHPAGEFGDRVEPELERGRHAEVAAAAADRPEEVRVRRGVHAERLAVGGDDVGGEERIDRHAELADEIADPAAEGDPADPDGAGVAETDREAVRAQRGAELGGGQTGLGPDGLPVDIDVDRLACRRDRARCRHR